MPALFKLLYEYLILLTVVVGYVVLVTMFELGEVEVPKPHHIYTQQHMH
jgi:hypothetical protein